MKKLLAILMVLVLSIGIVACTNDQQTPPAEDTEVENPTEEPNEDPTEEPDEKPDEEEPAEEAKEVTLYFVNEEFVETGDESLEKLVTETREIEVTDDNLEETIVRALMEGPETEGFVTLIPETAILNGVELTDGTAFVDFARDGMYGGSLQETYTISQIVGSLTELDSVDRVQFLIDGEVEESLMGHFMIDQPFENLY